MKNKLLFIFLFFICSSAFANTTVTKYRWRNDNGSETTATWKANLNTSTILDGSPIRLRFEVESDPIDPVNRGIQLQYKKVGETTWVDVTNDATTNHFVYTTSPNVSNLQNTTQQLNSGSFTSGGYSKIVSSTNSSQIPISAGSILEVEYVFKPTANASLSTEYEFRPSSHNTFNVIAKGTTAPNLVFLPDFENSTPSASSINKTSFILETDINQAGTIYYVVVADGATAPTISEIKAGTGSGGSGEITKGNATISIGNFTQNFNVTGLTLGTNYDVYVVAEDTQSTPNVQTAATKLDVTTTLGLQLWLKANDGLTKNASNEVTAWVDQSSFTTSVTPNGMPKQTHSINFNPVVSFDNTDTQYFNIDLSGIDNTDYSLIAVAKRTSNISNNHILGTSPAGPNKGLHFGYKLNGTATQSHFANDLDMSVSNFDAPEIAPVLLHGQLDKSVGRKLSQLKAGTLQSKTDTNTASLSGFTASTLGRGFNSESFEGEIAEVIVYNATLPNTEVAKIYSYLAIKYGLTLDNTGGFENGDYVASDGTTLYWDASENTSYYNDITIIAKDDDFDLHQPKSKSENSNALLTIEKTGGITNDKSAIAIGNNNQAFAFSATNAPTGFLTSDRIWKMQKTGALNTIDISVDVAGNSGVLADYKLLVNSSAATFSSGTTTFNATSISGNTITFGNITTTNNAYFTVAEASIDKTALLPANNATSIALSTNLEITFNKNVSKGTGNITIFDASDDSAIQVIDVTSTNVVTSNNKATIQTNGNLLKGKSYYVQIASGAFKDSDNNPFLGVLDKTTWSFSTIANVAPTFSSTPTTSASANNLYSYDIAINDTDDANTILDIDATTLPSWLTFTKKKVTTLAGSGNYGFKDDTGTNADFINIEDIVTDSNGNIYVMDNLRIRKITPAGVVTTFAGSGNLGNINGTGTNASFQNMRDLTIDSNDNLFLLESNVIKKITPSAVVTTFAGSSFGYTDSTVGTNAKFSVLTSIGIDANDNLYVTERTTYGRLRKITPTGAVTTVVANNIHNIYNAVSTGLVANSDGSEIYISYQNYNLIIKITNGVVSTLTNSAFGFADGTLSSAQFNRPSELFLDDNNNLFVSDVFNRKIRKITPAGVVSSVIGRDSGDLDGNENNAKFTQINDFTITKQGILYLADVRKLKKIVPEFKIFGTPNGTHVGSNAVNLALTDGVATTNQNFTITVSDAVLPTVANLTPSDDATEVATGDALIVRFNEPIKKGTGSITLQNTTTSTTETISVGSTNVTINGNLLIIKPANRLIDNNSYYVNIPNTAILDLANNAFAGFTDATTWNFTTENNTAPTISSATSATAEVGSPFKYEVAISDPEKDFIATTITGLPSWLQNKEEYNVTTIAGRNSGATDGTGTDARFSFPNETVVDKNGNIFVADYGNHKIRKIDTNGVVTTFAGSGTAGNADGVGTAASFNLPTGIAIDKEGFLYVTGLLSHNIRKISPTGQVTTIAGTGASGSNNGLGTSASFNQPRGIVVDASGNIFVADTQNHMIRKIDQSGQVTTYAGSTSNGNVDGNGTNASFSQPYGITIDSNGNLYVADYINHRIRKIDINRNVTTIAGSSSGNIDANGTSARFKNPRGITITPNGIIYVSDTYNHSIRKIATNGDVTTVAGSGFRSFRDGIGANAYFYEPYGIALGENNDLIVGDARNNRIRRINITPVLEGTPALSDVGTASIALNADDLKGATANQNLALTIANLVPTISDLAPLDNATGIAIDSILRITFSEKIFKGTGNINIHDASDDSVVETIDVTTNKVKINNLVVNDTSVDIETSKLTYNKNYYINMPSGVFKDVVNNDFAGIADKTTWNFTSEINLDPTFTSTPVTSVNENASYNYTITTTDPEGDNQTVTSNTLPTWLTPKKSVSTVTTLAGSGNYADVNGIGTNASFRGNLRGIVVDSNDNIFVSVQQNRKIKKITPTGLVSDFVGNGSYGNSAGTGTNVGLADPTGMTIDSNDNIYLLDRNANSLKKITPTGVVTILAGGGCSGDVDGTLPAAKFNYPDGIALDSNNNIYIADTGNHKIRKITPSGTVTTLAGRGSIFSGDADGTGTDAQFNRPTGIAIDSDGNVYVGDGSNRKIRKITPAGVVTTFAGNGSYGNTDGTGTNATFSSELDDIVIDKFNNLYVTDQGNNSIRKITSNGVVTTLVGNGSGDLDGPVATAKFAEPRGITLDKEGNFIISDQGNYKIRKINNTINSLEGNPTTAEIGNYPIQLTVKDGKGGSSQQNFTIAVKDITVPLATIYSPLDDATNVLINSNLQITFNEDMAKGTGNIKFYDASDDSVLHTIDVTSSQVSINNKVVTINPSFSLLKSKNYYVQIDSGALTDVAGNDFVGISDKTSWSFGTEQKVASTFSFADISKTYGDANFNLSASTNSTGTISYSIVAGGTGTATLSGTNNATLSVGNVGTVKVKATLAEDSNYFSASKIITLTITQKAITITADAKSKVYGETDPTLTYKITTGSLVGSDAFTGSLSRATGEDVGTYAIASTLANSNYNITFVADNLSITQKAITITADAKSKVYGDADPTLTYQITTGSLVGSDAFTGSLSRATGEDVGTYAIASTLANSNYNITFVADNLSITQKAITITADAKSKVYGDSDPTLTYQITTGSLVGSDVFTGSLSRATGENVGTYAIASTLANSNYNITFVADNLSITQKAITITADAKTKVYGEADPTLTYQITTGSLVGSDVFTGSLSRATGENVGNYAISSTLNNANYNITFTSADLSITQKAITITADAKSKVYGDADPTLTYKITTGSLVGSDVFTGSLSRATGENVGTYAIASTLANSNYNITFVADNLSITQKAITITADAKSKVYGDADPTLTYQITTGSLVGSDVFTGSLSRATGENVGNYAISSTLNNANYNITFTSADLSITQKAITITADAKSKVYGDADPTLTYKITTGSLVGSDVFTGSLSRATGENVGTYAIASTLANSNYNITFVADNLSITQKAITITADAKSKVYGETDPTLSYQITSGSLETGDSLTGSLSRATGEDVGTYAISSTLANSNYNITFVADNLSITQKAITITADAKSKVYGETDPTLSYQITSGSLETGDSLTGSLSRATGEDVGTYAISSTLANSNYNITFVADNLSITQKAITITADAKSKVYGESDPTLTYQITTGSLVGRDVFTGSLSRATGENVGNYAISSTLNNANYNITFTSADLSITQKAITITADAKSKVYGEADPTLTYQITTGSLVGSDVLTGNLSRTTGEDVGNYAIASTLANSNYNITFVADNLSITQKAITITADAKSKVYGDADPTLTYQITTGSLVGSDVFTGNLSRTTGEDVGNYAIASTLANSNYNITFVADNLSITQKAITITADAKSKVYGEADPTLTYKITTGSLVGSDVFTGSLSRATGEDVGKYSIASTLANSNYNITFVAENLTITKAILTVTITSGQTKVYGTPNPTNFNFTVTGFVNGDSLADINTTGMKISRESGEDVGTYKISITGIADLNYDINLITAVFTITKANQTITFGPLSHSDKDSFELKATASSGLDVVYTSSDTSIATISGNIINVISTGTVTITASQPGNINYNPATDVGQQLVITVLSVQDEILSDKKVFIYPNPAKNTLKISLGIEKASVTIYDINGKLVKKQRNYISDRMLDISNLPIGVYLIKIKSDNNIITKRLVKAE
ncbi:MBG domain-containing protein [Polaribacter cellanae]|uniref:Ig-like domain-containing protein n=1 Tax=Polaribacter cellanae TaxID=2818493 RepID=A0A975CQL7_9FLAO|nr:MBG domain-containing protein [Polaribacter cellanae]QTE24336.1 Ig-like domain-containing protein [Polaribacter cellanae]